MFSGTWVPECLGEELRETSYQIYSAAKGISPKIERDAVNNALSIFTGLKSINKNCFIYITCSSSPNLTKITINYRIFSFFFTFIAKILKQWVCQAAYSKAVWMKLPSEQGGEQIAVISFNIKIIILSTTTVEYFFLKKDIIY